MRKLKTRSNLETDYYSSTRHKGYRPTHSDNVKRNDCALILGAGINGLGLLRSLAREGIAMRIANASRYAPGMWSRYGRKISLSSMEGRPLVEELLALAEVQHWQGKSRPVLFFTNDRAVLTVSQYRDELKEAFRFRLPESPILKELMNKGGFQKLAEKANANIPKGLVLSDTKALKSAATMRYPLVLKPIQWNETYHTRNPKAYMIHSYPELVRLYKRIGALVEEWIVQEWIDGSDSDIFFCTQYHCPNRGYVSFVGRKLSSWPSHVGITASCIIAPDVAGELETMTSAFFQAYGVVGMASMEYKRDRRTGGFVMIEPTVGCVDDHIEVAALNGVNIPVAAYRMELDLPVPNLVSPKRPTIWRLSTLNKDDAAAQYDTLGINRIPIVDAVWRYNDPLPGCILLARKFAGYLGYKRTVEKLEAAR